MFVENNGIVYDINPATKTGKVKYSDCMLQEATIEEKIQGCVINEIASKAFYHDEKLKFVKIPSTVKKIKNSSFEGCKKLEAVIQGNYNYLTKVENIGYFAFRGCAFNKISLPSIKTLGKGAFMDCKSLLFLNIPDNSLNVLEEDVIYNCESLQEFTFPSSMNKAKNNFAGSTNLKKMVFNNPELDVMPFIANINKNVILFGDQGSKVQNVALYGFNFMLKSFMK